MSVYSFKYSNIRKTWLIFIGFLVVIIGIGWFFSYIYNDPGILYIAVVFSVLTNLITYWNSDKIVLKISGAKEADKNYFKEIYNIVENISITAGIPSPKVYIINDYSANAFATGRNPKHSSIAVTTGLIEKLNKSEIEGVIAHEISHIKNYDILLQTVVVILVGFIALASDFFMRSMLFRGKSNNNSNKGQLGAILMIVGVILAIITPILGMLTQMAISRKREFLADASGVLLTRYPEGLSSALKKISKDSPMAKANKTTAHLFIANPFKADTILGKKTPFLIKMFMTHPPIEERIEALEKMQ